MAIASSQLWTAGTSQGAATTGYTRIYINESNQLISVSDSGIETILNLPLFGTSDPTTTTNPLFVGMVYINTTSGVVFICTDATTNANVWVGRKHSNITGASDPTTTTNPISTDILYTNTTSGSIFTCTDSTTDANVWIKQPDTDTINLQGSANPLVTTNPVSTNVLYTNTSTGVIFTCTSATTDSNTWIGTDATTIP